jgi:hydrogenase maturation protease
VPAPRLAVGLGHPDRGDDAIGGLVVAEVARRRPDLEVRHLLDPLALLDLLPGIDALAVVDAAVDGQPTGTVGVHDVSAHTLPEMAVSTPSTHGLSLGTMLDLARTTGALPSVTWVVTVSGDTFDTGALPQPRVRAAVGDAAARVIALLSQEGSG